MTLRTMSIRKSKIRVEITPGFMVLLGVLLYLDDGSGILGWGCIAALVHEMGHVITCVLLGGRVEALSLSLVGAELKLIYPVVQSYGRENFVLLSGSTFNLLTGTIAFIFGVYSLSLLSFGLGVFNLLPVVPLDGGRILYNLFAERFEPVCADQIVRVVSGVFVGVLMGIGGILAVKYANILLIGLSTWLLLGIIKKNHNFSPNK